VTSLERLLWEINNKLISMDWDVAEATTRMREARAARAAVQDVRDHIEKEAKKEPKLAPGGPSDHV
jgi:hypothetical protein